MHSKTPSPQQSGQVDAPATDMDRQEQFATRRKIIREGAKLAFVAPVLSTFFASEARAAGSNHSCYPAGHACGGVTLEECCPTLTCVANTCQ